MMVAAEIQQALSWPDVARWQSVHGGDINQCYRVDFEDKNFFVKLNSCKYTRHFDSEVISLNELSKLQIIRVPEVIHRIDTNHHACLVMEYIPLSNQGNDSELGRQLATLHSQANTNQYGWSENNFIGNTPQPNHWSNDWGEFFSQNRIQHQLDLAKANGIYFHQSESLVERIRDILNAGQPTCSLVHGDLWSGNRGYDQEGNPVIFDPACYYGDSEVDIAMTELFGGFSKTFYEGYYQVLPKRSGYDDRRVIYNLYHLLNHLNIFGSSYLPNVRETIARIESL